MPNGSPYTAPQTLYGGVSSFNIAPQSSPVILHNNGEELARLTEDQKFLLGGQTVETAPVYFDLTNKKLVINSEVVTDKGGQKLACDFLHTIGILIRSFGGQFDPPALIMDLVAEKQEKVCLCTTLLSGHEFGCDYASAGN